MKNLTLKESGLSFELNTTDFTASLISSPKAKGEIFIPRKISYDNQDYVIKSIKDGSFKGNDKIRIVKFAEDSEITSLGEETFAVSSLISIEIPQQVTQLTKYLFNNCKYLKTITIPQNSLIKTIDAYSLSFSQIESLTFSDHIEKLEEGWCMKTEKLNKIIISPHNKNFSYLDKEHKLIAGKSNLNQTDFDVLVFASRDVKTVSIPPNIKYIGEHAFHECKSLQEVNFEGESQLISIGKNAFNKSSLKKIFIPQNVDKIGDCCFAETFINSITISPNNKRFTMIDEKILVAKSDVKSDDYDTIVFAFDTFTNVVIPSFIKTISPYSFYKNKKLTMALFSEDSQLVSIGESCFSETSLTMILIPKHVKEIGTGAFASCKELKLVEFPPSSELELISEAAFYETSIEKISIPEMVKKIGEFSFGRCLSLQEVLFEVNSRLELIDKDAFAESGIKTFYLPSHVKKIEEEAFTGCTDLSSFHFPRVGETEIIGKRAFSDSAIKSIVIPNYVKEIQEGAFFNCYFLRVVEIPFDSELILIGESAFNNCTLVEIFLPPKIKNIMKNTFVDCNNFCGISFPRDSELTTIGKNAFSNSLMEEFSLPPKLTELSGKSFINVPLNVINISKDNHNFTKQQNNILLKKSDPKLPRSDIIILGYNQIKKYQIPANIKQIAPYAFYQCYDLASITFKGKSSLQSIGKNAFVSTSIKTFTFPKNVQKIEKKTFYDCSQLKTVEFEDDSLIQSIEKEAFCKSGIETLHFPPQLKEINYCWCSYTTSLVNIIISPNNPHFRYLDIENKKIIVGKSNPVTSNFDSIFFACRDISSVKIPDYIKYIKTFAFDSCRHLKSVEFGQESKLLSIERNAFSSTGIESFVVPKTVKEIEKKAFINCKSLSRILFSNESELFYIGNYAFAYTAITEITIPPLVKKVGENLFTNCSELLNATFLSETFFIDYNCFDGCLKLAEVSFPNAKLIFKEENPFEKASKDFKLNINGADVI